MMEIEKPNLISEQSADGSYIKITVEPLERGFGITLGNALRRVLLSALPGIAPVGVKIDGVDDEFTTIDCVVEDVPEIILNLKCLALKSHNTDKDFRPALAIHKEGPCEVLAADIETDAEVEVLNPELLICTIEKGGRVDCDIYCARGRGYVSAERNKEIVKEQKLTYPVGFIAIDSLYSPVKKVNYNVDNARVGHNIGFDKLTLECETNGAFLAREIVSLAAKILNDHIEPFRELSDLGKIPTIVPGADNTVRPILEKSIDDMELSVRSYNCLKRAGIQKVGDIVKMTEDDMLKVRNLGKKSLDEIFSKLQEYGLQLKNKDD